MAFPGVKNSRSFVRADGISFPADEIDRSLESRPVDFDLDHVPFDKLADRTSGQGFGPSVPDAGSGAYARKTCVGQERDLLAPGQMFQGQSELSHLFHSGAHRTTATQDDYVAGLDRPLAQAFERLHGFLFRMEYPGRARHSVNSVLVDDRRVDGSAFHHRAFRSQVSPRETNRTGQALLLGDGQVHDDVVRVHLVLLGQYLSKAVAPGRTFPILEIPPQGISSASHGIEGKQVEIP